MWKVNPSGSVTVRNPTTLRLFFLNKTMADVWRALDGHRSVGEAIEELKKSAPDVLFSDEDVIECLTELAKYDLVQEGRRSMWTGEHR